MLFGSLYLGSAVTQSGLDTPALPGRRPVPGVLPQGISAR